MGISQRESLARDDGAGPGGPQSHTTVPLRGYGTDNTKLEAPMCPVIKHARNRGKTIRWCDALQQVA